MCRLQLVVLDLANVDQQIDVGPLPRNGIPSIKLSMAD